jgi:3-isopropylmalate/(R)-2-methylmalate dehydratase small subunit
MRPFPLVEGAVTALARDDVDTDQIVPKQFLKRLSRTGFAETLFYDWRQEPGWELPANPILATGRNFGSGSSREQAAWALDDYGFRTIIAPSFGDIFYFNCTKVGLLPVVLDEHVVRAIMDAGAAAVDLERREVRWPGGRQAFEIEDDIRRRLLDGVDDVGLTLRRLESIEAFEARHPPLSTTTVEL